MNQAELFNEAGTALTKMDALLGAATERMGVKDYAAAQKNLSEAHGLLGTAGAALGKVADVVLAPVIGKPVIEAPIATAGNFDPTVSIVNTDSPHVYDIDPSAWTPENWAWFGVQGYPVQSRVDQQKWIQKIQAFGPGGSQYDPTRKQTKPSNFN